MDRQECICYMRADDSPVDYAPWKNPDSIPFTGELEISITEAFSGAFLCIQARVNMERLSQSLAY